MRILLDTSVWIKFGNGDSSLSKKLVKKISNKENELYLSPISSWEALVLIRKGRLKVNIPASTWVSDRLNDWPLNRAPLTHEISILSESLEFEHNDPADRFIAATAVGYKCSLATEDERLLRLKWLECI